MNKTITLIVFLTITANNVIAQTSSGNMMLGGTFDFNSVSRQSGSANDFNSVTFSPSFGYFVSENFALGTSVTLTSTRTGTGSAKTVGSSFAIGPFARYYFFTANDRFAFFGQAALNFGSGKTDPPAGAVTKNTFISFSVAPGAAYFFTDHWAMELSIAGLAVSSTDPDTANDNDKVTRVEFDIRSFSPGLGLRYHF